MQFFSRMKIGKRLFLGFAAVFALCIVITGIAIIQLDTVASATKTMMQIPLAKERYISDWSRNINVAVIRTTAVAKSSDASLGPFFKDNAAEITQSTSSLVQKIEPLIAAPEEKALFQRIGEVRKDYLAVRDQVTTLKADGNIDEANRLLETGYLPKAQGYIGLVGELLAMQRKSLDDMAVAVQETEHRSRNYLIVLAACAVILGAMCAWSLAASITRPLHEAVAAARRVADGDLTADIAVNSACELGQLLGALKEMNGKLSNIVGQVHARTGTIAVASAEIASGNQDLSARTEQQAASVEETAASVEELSATVAQNLKNARHANSLAGAASSAALRGGEVMTEVVGTMNGIQAASQKIVEIIAVIDGIAFQTNILALNAAVEAARAGEQGRGFAVVASEVRTLAQRSANAARDVKALINDSVDKVNDGTSLVQRAGATMDEIVQSVRHVTDIMEKITVATQEQSAGIGNINSALVYIDNATQQNAALVEEASAAAATMQEQSETLAQLVTHFKVNGQT
jgi:methyl-accepting chemotaxis protein